jgi:large subunit ribosomal protein L3
MARRQTNKGLICQKVGMTRVVDAAGDFIPVTLLKITTQQVAKVLSPERDGYNGYQVGYWPKSKKNLTQADHARLAAASLETSYSKFREFRTPEAAERELAETLSVALLEGITSVDITGVTKGRGFQGAVKRFGASIGRKSHGSRFHRRPGSLGMRSTPGRVFKNKHQPGHMGVDVTTVQNLVVVNVDVERNLIAVKGSVPGHREGYLEIRPSRAAVKTPKAVLAE